MNQTKQENIKINPKLLKPLRKLLNKIPEEKQMEYLETFLAEVDQIYKEAEKYAKSNNVDFAIALKHIFAEHKTVQNLKKP